MQRILTVDDTRTIRSILLMTLDHVGYEVFQAEDGIEALEMLDNVDPDLLITDIYMPRLDGFGLIEKVRCVERYHALPILVLTTESDAQSKERARKAGASGWITKPIDDAKLLSAVRRVLD